MVIILTFDAIFEELDLISKRIDVLQQKEKGIKLIAVHLKFAAQAMLEKKNYT